MLEIGTGRATSPPSREPHVNVWSIEIIPPWQDARAISTTGCSPRLQRISRDPHHNADGYYGWEESAPFDKIIVTCGIDHIPPPLLQQLNPEGIMLIPVGPPARSV